MRHTSSRTIPGVYDLKTTVLKVCNITRGEPGSSHLGNGRDLRIRVADRSAERTAASGNLGEHSRCLALKSEDATRQILGKHSFRRCQQPLATLAFGEQLNSIKDFRLGYGRGKEFRCSLFRNPYHNPSRGLGSHQLGDHIRVEDDHSPNPGAWRIASRRGNSSSSPPNAAKRR